MALAEENQGPERQTYPPPSGLSSCNDDIYFLKSMMLPTTFW